LVIGEAKVASPKGVALLL